MEQDLKNIRNLLAEQAKRVQSGIKDAIYALQTNNHQLAYHVILLDHPINRAMRNIDRHCHHFIALHLPSGANLRLLSSAIRINIALERIGDYAVTIAREAVQLPPPDANNILYRELDRLANESLLMLKQSIQAFNELNADFAHSSMLLSENVEYDLNIIYDQMTDTQNTANMKCILALFVIFTHLKRVSDQSKNICEETIFSVTGEQKKPKIYRILFIDEENNYASQLAEVIARKNYPDWGEYRSAGRTANPQLHPDMLHFLSEHGEDSSQIKATNLDTLTNREIQQQHVIVSLQGTVKSYIDPVPFHTTALEWDIKINDNNTKIDEVYRSLALNIKDLMELLRGSEV